MEIIAKMFKKLIELNAVNNLKWIDEHYQNNI